MAVWQTQAPRLHTTLLSTLKKIVQCFKCPYKPEWSEDWLQCPATMAYYIQGKIRNQWPNPGVYHYPKDSFIDREHHFNIKDFQHVDLNEKVTADVQYLKMEVSNKNDHHHHHQTDETYWNLDDLVPVKQSKQNK
ncbi:hypothetical protein C0J50_1476 [Silurus asotus]|uniref:Uncharacterized protein n=1 Tax=Silurus asotus TaxID=30991 RepID=A0AAD5FCR1_SILAS|nr:hypothetical protein C0J50_1476 [Silurus asotus]